jgi:hypothetical protein
LNCGLGGSNFVSIYEIDFYRWTVEQAAALRDKAWERVDVEAVAEEIESLGRRDRREIGLRLEILLIRLLKYQYQPELRCGSWRGSIVEARAGIAAVIDDSPSLKLYPAACFDKAWQTACRRTLAETGLYHLPEACPWSVEQVLDLDFMP